MCVCVLCVCLGMCNIPSLSAWYKSNEKSEFVVSIIYTSQLVSLCQWKC